MAGVRSPRINSVKTNLEDLKFGDSLTPIIKAITGDSIMAYNLAFNFLFVYVLFSHCLSTAESSNNRLITAAIDDYIKTAIHQWNLTGLAIAVVRKDSNSETGWHEEFNSYGIARADGTPVTPETLFGWASNSKLVTALATGLLFSNETLLKERDIELSRSTKAKDIFGDLWGLWDEGASNGVTIQDMLSHRTGLPRHDISDIPRKEGLADTLRTLRYLRPSAELRETYQYNNLMYNSLGYLPQLLVNETLSSYVDQHIFKRLNMSSATYSVKQAEEGPISHGFQVSAPDAKQGKDGVKMEVVPYFVRPGDEDRDTGCGGVIGSAKDAATWMSTLLALGHHPQTNEQIIPPEVVEHAATGVTVATGASQFPEISDKIYGEGQVIYSYRGYQVVEHSGGNIAFSSVLARLPNDNLGIVLLNNDWGNGHALYAIVWRLVDEIIVKGAVPGTPVIDWISRYKKLETEGSRKTPTPRPKSPTLPPVPFSELDGRIYSHLTYGRIQPCYVYNSLATGMSEAQVSMAKSGTSCRRLLSSLPARRIINISDLSIPTFIASFKSTFTTHLRLSHFSGNLFNVTAFWTNAQVRLDEGLGSMDGGVWTDDADAVLSFFGEHFVEWETEGIDEGLAFRGNIWGMEAGGKEPKGNGKEGAEVWFSRVVN